METRKRALGMGLEQLFNNENLDLTSIEKQIYETVSKEEIIEIPISELRPNPYQPRKIFDNDKLKELSESIKEHGVFQPIIVKKSIKGYEIIAGERRYRASKLAGLEKIPAKVRNFTDDQMMEIALLENLQRENLNAIEEAVAYKSMIDKMNITQDELSKKVGKSRSHITNILGLLRLPRVISKLESREEMIELATKIIKEQMPVRDLEKISVDTVKKNKTERKTRSQSSEYKYVEDMMSDKLDTKVKIKEKKIHQLHSLLVMEEITKGDYSE